MKMPASYRHDMQVGRKRNEGAAVRGRSSQSHGINVLSRFIKGAMLLLNEWREIQIDVDTMMVYCVPQASSGAREKTTV